MDGTQAPNPNNAHLPAAPRGVPVALLEEIPVTEGEDHPHGVSAHAGGLCVRLLTAPIPCSELIQRYREKSRESERCAQEAREARTHACLLEQSVVGLKAELQAVHEANRILERDVESWTARVTNAEVRCGKRIGVGVLIVTSLSPTDVS